jgi:nucleoside-diphosphate kinase
MEQTLLLIKPDGVQRGLIGKIISRVEEKGLKVVGLKFIKLSIERARELYSPHKGKPFFEPTVAFMTSSPLVAMVVEGRMAIKLVRAMNGATRPEDALAGTIRGDFATSVQLNVVHASELPADATREIPIFFNDSEIFSYPLISEMWSGNQKEAGLRDG